MKTDSTPLETHVGSGFHSQTLPVGDATALLVQHAPLPERLTEAKSVYLVNDSGDLKAYDKFYAEMQKWGRFKIAKSRDAAEIVAVLTSSSQYALTIGTGTVVQSGAVSTATVSSVAISDDFLHLKIFDSRNGEVLWSDSTEKWVTSSGHAPGKLVSHLKKRFPF